MKNRVLRYVKTGVGPMLRTSPRLYALASRLLYSADRSFHTLSPGAPDAIARALALVRESSANELDYYEFGLFRGFTLLSAQIAAREQGLSDMHFYGFDSFAGLPAIGDIDRKDNLFFEGQFACSKAEVVLNLERHGAGMSDITLIEGFFDDVLTPSLREEHDFRRAGVVFLDCDLYESTATVLEWMSEYVDVGTAMLFDDWFSFGDEPDLGQQRAFGEFLKRNPQYEARELYDFEPHGRAFLIERSQRAR